MRKKDLSKRDIEKSVSFLSDDECNFGDYVELYRRLLLLDEGNKVLSALSKIKKLLSFNEKIFSSPSVAETFMYFCLNGAATAWVLQNKLNIPEATTYRAMKRLRALGILVPAIKVSKVKNSKGGPRPTVWALKNASTEEISAALRLHFRTISPKYRVAEEIAQTIMDEYSDIMRPQEISYREIMIRVRELHIPFRIPDIANLTAQYLHENGIKVWR